MARPVLFVLAGVNGAGKSSIGGHLLKRAGVTWFNPDTFARELRVRSGCSQARANALAWSEGVRRLDEAVARRSNYAFETTLAGRTVTGKVAAATGSHDVVVWFCGLASVDHHLRRVRARVEAGGHDIPEARIRERYQRVLQNLIALMPHLTHLRVYDNSAEVAAGASIPDPVLVLEMQSGKPIWPASDDVDALGRTPEWARPLVERALMS